MNAEAPLILFDSRMRFLAPHLAGYRLIDWHVKSSAPTTEAIDEVRAAVTVGDEPLPPHIEALPHLGLLAVTGAGFDGIQTDRLFARGIEITHSPGANAPDVADHAMALFLALQRRVIDGDRRVRDGSWVDYAMVLQMPSIRDLRVGILGMGAIGEQLAKRLAAFDCPIRWHGPRPRPGIGYPRADSLIDLARDSDVLFLAHRANDSNRGLIDGVVLDALGPKGLLVNISRGLAIDEALLIDALRRGRIAGAAIDVFDPEPVTDARWADAPNCVLSPHVGGVGLGSWATIGKMVRNNLDLFFAGQPVANPIPR